MRFLFGGERGAGLVDSNMWRSLECTCIPSASSLPINPVRDVVDLCRRGGSILSHSPRGRRDTVLIDGVWRWWVAGKRRDSLLQGLVRLAGGGPKPVGTGP